MLLLNFAHHLTEEHKRQLEEIVHEPIRVRDLQVHFDLTARKIMPQVVALVDSVALSADEWQTEVLLVNPPALNIIAAAVLAELHGRMGYFPALVRLRRVENSLPPRFEVAEILNLQDVREKARARRYPA